MAENKKTAGETANIEVYQWKGNGISFRPPTAARQTMVNATEMAKPFGKTPKDWLRTNPAQEFINTLSAVRHICLTGLVVVNQGGRNQGTWMHEDVAMEFARWLSPEFGIWCNDVVKGLMVGMHQAVNFMAAHPEERYYVERRRKVVPRDRSEEMRAFYAELGRWVLKEDVMLVAGELGLKEGTVRSALRGTGSNLRVLELLVPLAAGNREAGRRSDIGQHRPDVTATALEQLRKGFMIMSEEGGAR